MVQDVLIQIVYLIIHPGMPHLHLLEDHLVELELVLLFWIHKEFRVLVRMELVHMV